MFSLLPPPQNNFSYIFVQNTEKGSSFSAKASKCEQKREICGERKFFDCALVKAHGKFKSYQCSTVKQTARKHEKQNQLNQTYFPFFCPRDSISSNLFVFHII
jgi:hypothetical protein